MVNRKEVENLGWKLSLGSNVFRLDNWMLQIWDDHRISIIIEDLAKNDDSLIQGITPSVHYLNIKSKFQLKLVMKQLNIKLCIQK